MSKTPLLYYMFGLLAVVLGFYACEREDGEPDLEMRQFTRLYVSFEEYRPEHQQPPADTNLRIIYPADSSEFTFNGRHVSDVKGGGVMHFAREVSALFHASVNRAGTHDTLISILNVGSSGSVTNAGKLGSRYYSNVKGMAYHHAANVLYVVNGSGPDAGVYVVESPRYSTREKQPVKKLRNSNLNMWGAAYENDRLFAAKTTAPSGIYVFDGITSKEVRPVDSVGVNPLTPDRILEIEDATSLRGLFYDTVRNVMAVTDAGNGVGRVLIFENFSSMANSETPITPTRIITGANTGLVRPVDVVLDTREEGAYLYVVDNNTRKISRFLYTDNGDVEPNKVIDASNLQYGRTPVSLALDTRR